jgi:hypothetical protein
VHGDQGAHEPGQVEERAEQRRDPVFLAKAEQVEPAEVAPGFNTTNCYRLNARALHGREKLDGVKAQNVDTANSP